MTLPPPEHGVVRITIDNIYQQLVILTDRVNASLAKNDRTEQTVAEHEAELRPLAGAADRLADHEARLRSIERGRWPLASLAVLLPIVAIVISVLIALAGKK